MAALTATLSDGYHNIKSLNSGHNPVKIKE